ncbi:hypothetical protein A3D78_03310 [Candidatus Gottesmanbacteria bacterium RIFCSPHIGHO2_02_FULL_39_14]|uniref:Uncharacterized protein n=3 Tax=Candidatus Gottesmaniibacteriota TaxID=1752720 RepID=A0A1F5ZU03_9BACT|nr:MAG: hypothetical protein A2153_03955 [Candidatus Gottesmanbacteria bacterium RBG_16_38_7b]OGG15958.1 MAG: hypothetical protein A3D78_03310 [Candidatus Gottesmanbacteria bacterium RIFCSPHIGHO2_02_FULL_39_14]OGG31104.1 MAG: hypothetical protein A3I51_05710 [Candidatus Gottesmanbacteria bacterium RIFCSPLOWO2_02_FULL_38_8]
MKVKADKNPKYIPDRRKTLQAFAGGIILSVITLILFFYIILVPRYEKNLEKQVEERTNSFWRNREYRIPVLSPTPIINNCPKCQEQIYNWDNIMEFYSIKVADPAWVKLESNRVGIRFEYPIEANKLVMFEFNEWGENISDPSGTVFVWSTRGLGEEFGEDYFAQGASKDIKVGREEVFLYNWTESEGKYYVNDTNGNSYKVENIFTREIPAGGRALLFNTLCFWEYKGGCEEIEYSKTLIVNFPLNHREKIESILFNIPAGFTDADIERLIESIDFIK